MARITSSVGVVLPALLLSVLVTPASAQRVVRVEHEPRHRVVYASPELRVMDIQIQPGDTTLYHTHDTPITYVTIGTSSTDQMVLGGRWNQTVARTPPPGRIGAIRAVLSYADAPVTHRVTNVGRTLFRLIGIPSLRPGVDAPAAGTLPGEVVAESRWFRHAVVTAESGGRTGVHTAGAPTVLVLTEGARVAIEHADGWVTSLERPGDVAVVARGDAYELMNESGGPTRLAVVEVR